MGGCLTAVELSSSGRECTVYTAYDPLCAVVSLDRSRLCARCSDLRDTKNSLYNNFTPNGQSMQRLWRAETVACRDGGVLSGNEPGGAGLQRASENQDNPAQKAGHTTTVQRSENQGETNREHDTRTACNELTKTT
ncbi:hypothetical protein DPX16_17563 [Anabarilius grahami]|uniref:Uncharacterized protein n=1 Tax=Anabarilius grahami TaxID=495550 RepID=A0A3N0Y121_ANAGA|nr:hypothetical protein DPX16_17563 [Anabarilius grahami]